MPQSKSFLQQKVANAALSYIKDNVIVGVGTGATVNYFIEELNEIKHKIEGTVASSLATEKKLRACGIPVFDLNAINELTIYIDSADEVNELRQMLKGGGGALTREKILANVAQEFICIVDESKYVQRLGKFPLVVEVLPMARSFVGRELVKLGGDPTYRNGFITDNGNIILDVYNLPITYPEKLEETIKNIPGVIDNGLFAKRIANRVLLANEEGVTAF